MTDDAEKTRQILADQHHPVQPLYARDGRRGKLQMPHQPSARQDRQKALEQIPHGGDQRRQLALGTEHVGRPGIAAAVPPDVILGENLGNDDGGIDAAQQIGGRHGQQQGQPAVFQEFHEQWDCLLQKRMVRGADVPQAKNGGRAAIWTPRPSPPAPAR